MSLFEPKPLEIMSDEEKEALCNPPVYTKADIITKFVIIGILFSLVTWAMWSMGKSFDRFKKAQKAEAAAEAQEQPNDRSR